MHLYLTAIAIQEEKIRQAQRTSQGTIRSPIRSWWAELSSRLLHKRDSAMTKAIKGSLAVARLADEK